MKDSKIKAKEIINKYPEVKDMTLQRREEIDAKLKELGLKSPGYVRGMMDDLSGISIVFLE